jgi:hypothetical protein
MLYNFSQNKSISITGSVAWYFKEIREEILTANNFSASKITRDTITGLIEFHIGNA